MVSFKLFFLSISRPSGVVAHWQVGSGQLGMNGNGGGLAAFSVGDQAGRIFRSEKSDLEWLKDSGILEKRQCLARTRWHCIEL